MEYSFMPLHFHVHMKNVTLVAFFASLHSHSCAICAILLARQLMEGLLLQHNGFTKLQISSLY